MILILAAVAASPAPSPAPSADPCGAPDTNLLAALNRPSIAFSPCAVKPREVVAELGYAEATNQAGHLATYPQGFIRFGVAPGLEIDAIAPGYAVQHVNGTRTTGAFDSGLGMKYEWWHDDTRALGVDFLFTASTGSQTFTAGAPTEIVNVDYSTPIAGKISFAATAGAGSSYAAARNGNSGRFFTALPSIVVADQWNPRAQAFVEVFGVTRTRPDGGATLGEDLSLQYLLSPQLEADVEIEHIANDVGQTHAIGFGFGARF